MTLVFLTNKGYFIFFVYGLVFGYWRLKGLSSTPGKSVAKVARLLGENRHQLKQHRDYSGREEVIFVIKMQEIPQSPLQVIIRSWYHGTLLN